MGSLGLGLWDDELPDTRGGFVIQYWTSGLVSLVLLLAGQGAWAQGDAELGRLQDEAIERLQAYIRVNTINPPGNESRGVEFFGEIFRQEGIPFESAESAPGRGNIWARLEGGDEPALVLLHHMDVVPADERYWDVDPLSGAIRNKYIYGRGALDTKTLGIVHLQAFLALHRMGVPLNRDVIFMATADEEAGGFFGAGWLVENRPELFQDVGLLLNEGGGSTRYPGRLQIDVEISQKVPLWLEVTARGEPGHGSTPRAETAVTRLIRALSNVQNHYFQPRIVPVVDAFFKAFAPYAEPGWREHFADMAKTVQNPELLLRLQLENPGLHALTRNTCSITMLEGSAKINVVPPEVTAQLDCRLVQDQDPDAFIETLTRVMNDPAVQIKKQMAFSPAASSTDTPLYKAIERVTRRHFPDAVIVPGVLTGFTDSHFFRDLGIASYGYGPITIPFEDESGIHGNNERVLIESVRTGVQVMVDVLREVVER